VVERDNAERQVKEMEEYGESESDVLDVCRDARPISSTR
jgi:hypothetical protein